MVSGLRRIAILAAHLLQKLIADLPKGRQPEVRAASGCHSIFKPVSPCKSRCDASGVLQVGIVQTAYGNGASTRYMRWVAPNILQHMHSPYLRT